MSVVITGLTMVDRRTFGEGDVVMGIDQTRGDDRGPTFDAGCTGICWMRCNHSRRTRSPGRPPGVVLLQRTIGAQKGTPQKDIFLIGPRKGITDPAFHRRDLPIAPTDRYRGSGCIRYRIGNGPIFGHAPIGGGGCIYDTLVRIVLGTRRVCVATPEVEDGVEAQGDKQ